MSHFQVRQEPDDVASRSVGRIAFWTIVLFVISAIGAVAYLRGIRGVFVVRASETRRAPREISMIEQTVFGEDHYARDLRREQLGQLTRFAPVPGRPGFVRIPIEEAVRLIVKESAL